MLTHIAAVWCRQEFLEKDEESLRLLEVPHASTQTAHCFSVREDDGCSYEQAWSLLNVLRMVPVEP